MPPAEVLLQDFLQDLNQLRSVDISCNNVNFWLENHGIYVCDVPSRGFSSRLNHILDTANANDV